MDKSQFLNDLSQHLSGLPEEDVRRTLEYYSENLDDRMEDGLTEEEAVAALDSPEAIAKQVISETPITSLVKANASRKAHRGAIWTVLLILGAPLWIPLLFAAAAVFLSLYLVLWVCVFVVGVIALAFAVSALAGIAVAVSAIFAVGGIRRLFLGIGAALLCFGLAVLFFFACAAAARGVAALTRSILFGIKFRLAK